jgi:uncharacterized surface protein with fasciclin (FAS1) repeats
MAVNQPSSGLAGLAGPASAFASTMRADPAVPMEKLMSRLRLASLLLAALLPFAAVSTAQADDATPPPRLAESLKAAGRFSIFLSLQEIAGATQGQRGATQGQRTWLVPNDAAFAQLPAGTLERLKSDPKRLDAFLRLHTVPTKLMVSDMFEQMPDSKKSFVSAEGHVLGFSCNGHTGMHQPRVKAFDGTTGTRSADAILREIRSSGVTKSPTGSTAAGPGGGPQAGKVSLQDLHVTAPTKPAAKGGVQVAVGDVTGDGAAARANTVQGNYIGTDAAAWAAPAQGRIGTFQDVLVAEGVVHELDGVLRASGITD